METNSNQIFQDMNARRKVIVNNQEIMVKQNMIQLDYLLKMDLKLQKKIKMIGVRIIWEFENSMTKILL
jgi:mRNA-degrading endonuclease RelE of RelBE toxin-antitoxin system